MFLGQLTAKTEVIIRLDAEGREPMFITTHVLPSGMIDPKMSQYIKATYGALYGAPISPLVLGGKQITLKNFGGKVTCECVVDNQAYTWSNIEILNMAVGNQNVQYIVSKNNVNSVNRRAAYRVPVNSEATTQIGLMPPVYSVLKDISTSGFGLSMDVQHLPNIKKNTPIRIAFADAYDSNATGEMTVNYDLLGYVVRVEKANKLTVGCQFKDVLIASNENVPLREYIRYKQRMLGEE